jgi:hypothetical protein
MVLSELAVTYAERREHDWTDFVGRSGPPENYWANWEEHSHSWKVPIEFMQPVGLDAPEAFAPLQPLLDQLDAMEEVDVSPLNWMHLTYVHVGFLRATDILWSQVESFYANASPRIRRVEPFTMKLGGISIADDERIYLGVDDGGSFRELRRQIRNGVPKVYERFRDDPVFSAEDGDSFVPQIDIGFLTGSGERQRVIEAVEPYREFEVGPVDQSLMKMARLPIQPHDHFADIDVVAEIPLLGAKHREGYHN